MKTSNKKWKMAFHTSLSEHIIAPTRTSYRSDRKTLLEMNLKELKQSIYGTRK